MLYSVGNSKAFFSSSSSSWNQRRGRDVGDVMSTSSKKEGQKRWKRGFFAVFTTMLPSLVAGQSMTCTGSDGSYVEASTATLAQMNDLVGSTGVTFVEGVRVSSILTTQLLSFSNLHLPFGVHLHLYLTLGLSWRHPSQPHANTLVVRVELNGSNIFQK